ERMGAVSAKPLQPSMSKEVYEPSRRGSMSRRTSSSRNRTVVNTFTAERTPRARSRSTERRLMDRRFATSARVSNFGDMEYSSYGASCQGIDHDGQKLFLAGQWGLHRTRREA